MRNVLSPSLKALIGEQLFRHPDDDVKVAVAACMSEITRMSAPEAPYLDDQMRVFQLIVSSCENLSDKFSHSYIKRTSILETVYLMQAVENSGISFEDYSGVVASICQVAPEDVVQNDTATEKRVDVESKPVKAPLGNAFQKDKEIPKESVLTEQVDHGNGKSPISVFSHGIVQTDENNSLPDSNSLKEQEDDRLPNKSENVDASTVAEPEGKGEKPHSKSTEPSESIHVDGKEVETLTDQKDDSKDDAHPPCKDPSVDGAVSMENKRATDVQPSMKKATEDESNDVASPAPSGTVPNESHSKKADRPKEKDGSSKKITPSVDDVSKKSSEKSDLEAKTNKRPGKKVASVVSNKNSETKKESGTASDSEETPLKQLSKKLDSSSKNADGASSRKLEDKKTRARGKLILPEKDRTKISTENDDEETVDSPKIVKPNKYDSEIDETPKTNSKRKHTQSKEKGSGTLEYDENLVGLKVKVWWPMDSTFYDGVIQSFDRIRKKHKVCYDDGDVEILNLKREKWEVISDEPGSDEEVAADHPSPDGSSEISEKKAKAADQLRKQPKMDAWPKRGGGASSGKSKGAAMKSGSKIKDGKVGGSKSVGKSDNVTKAKDHSPESGGTPVGVASKADSKSKNEDNVDTPKSTKPKGDDKPKDTASKVSSKSKNEDSVDTLMSTKPKDASSKVSSESRNEDSVDKPKSTIPKDAASKMSSKSKNKDSVDTPKSIKPKGDDKPKDAPSKVSSKSKHEDSVDTPKSTKPRDDDDVTPKATTKPKPDTSKTTKSKQETPKVSSNAKGKPLKTGDKSDANGGGKSISDSTKEKESESMQENSIDSSEAVVTFKRKKRSSEGQGSDSKSVKKHQEEPKATSTAES